ncbi:hypothetical protein GPEL0_01r0151 [Geoanaerobacter pelophilus]|uniref:Uncharacterized protein n=1 Tax=Geoanaerobacter pelophilus TaxID=60036 RepID=A0ABQ0MDZ8_9BACT|nr:hypothetical protein GPEL0_01r0151 [Geoanaerobacter pelophilus]
MSLMTAIARRKPAWSSFSAAATAPAKPEGGEWISYGGKKGKWVATTDPEYPVELIDTVENRRWRAGYSGSNGVLYNMSGSIWYEGRKAELKRK